MDNSQSDKPQEDKQGKRRARYGAFSAATTAAVLALLVIVNLIVSGLDIKVDLTTNKLYQISEDTTDVLDELGEDIVIYTLFRSGSESYPEVTLINELARQYERYSPHVRVENKDPYVNKAFVEQYAAELAVNSIVVVSGRRSKALDFETLSVIVEDAATGEYVSQIEIEPKLTNAIVYVTMEKTDKAYVLNGHGEEGIEGFEGYLEDANYEVNPLNLLTAPDIPADCDALIMTMPKSDISASEQERIAAYLANGGRLFISADYTAVPLPRFNALIETYGIAFQNVVVSEGNANFALPQSNMLILPVPVSHGITADMRQNGTPMLLYMANAVTETNARRPSTQIMPLLTTSDRAFGKSSAEGESPNKEQGDADGPFSIAVAVDDEMAVGKDVLHARIVAVAAQALFSEDLDAMVSGANSGFFINAMNWLIDRPSDYVYVAPKHLTGDAPLAFTGMNALLVKAFAMAALPAAILAAGGVIWLRRRNK